MGIKSTKGLSTEDIISSNGDIIGATLEGYSANAGTVVSGDTIQEAIEKVEGTVLGLTPDHGSLTGLGDDDHSQYHNDARGDARYYTEAELDGGQLDNRYFTEAEHINTSVGVGDAGKPIKLNASGLVDPSMVGAVSDHGSLTGLGDDDHTQYHNDTRGDARYFQKSEFLNTSAGAGDAGKPIKLDAGGHVDATMINDADVDHGNLTGLGDDDHSQYSLADGSRAFSGTVSGITPTIDANFATKGYVDSVLQGIHWQEPVLDIQTDGTLDPGASPTTGDRYIIEDSGDLNANFGTITGVGDDDIVEYDGADFIVAWDASVEGEGGASWVGDVDKNYFFNGTGWVSIGSTVDHGNLTGLGDDDHSQYHTDARGDARYFQKSEFINTSAGAGDAGKPIKLDAGGHVDATMINDGDISHGSLADLTASDDHTQYLLLDGRSGGQTAIGGIDSGDDLTLQSTSNGTRGNIFFGSAQTSGFDEVNSRLGIGVAAPTVALDIAGGGLFTEAINLTATALVSNVWTTPSNEMFFDLRGSSPQTNPVADNPGALLRLRNLNTTDLNFGCIIFSDKDNDTTSSIVGINVSHTSNHGALTFNTNAGSGPVEAMRINKDQQLLVGATAALDAEKMLITGDNSNSFMRLNNTDDQGFTIRFSDNGVQKFILGQRGQIAGNTDESMGYFTSSGISHRWMVNGSDTTVMDLSSAGLLGIGSAAGASILLDLDDVGGAIGQATVGFRNAGASKAQMGIAVNAGNVFSVSLANDTVIRAETQLLLGTNGDNVAMTIDTSQNVGIGTIAPGTRLSVVKGGTEPTLGAFAAQSSAVFTNTSAVGSINRIMILAGSTGATGISELDFGDADSFAIGAITYDHSSNSMRFRTNDVADRMVILSDGRVGVGTGSPQTGIKMTIEGSTTLRLRNPTIRYRSDFDITSGGLTINAFDDTGAVFLPMKLSASEFQFLEGDVGIGKSPSLAKLDIAGGIATTNTINISATASTTNVWTTTTDPMFLNLEGHSIGTNTLTENPGGLLRLRNLNTTDLNFNCIIFADKDNDTMSSIVGINVSHTSNTGALAFNVNNTGSLLEAMRIIGNGNVGIGNTDPSYPLTVTSDAGGTVASFRGRASDGFAHVRFDNNDGSQLNAMVCSDDAQTLYFYSGGATEAMRINASQQFLMGATAPIASERFLVSGSSNSNAFMRLDNKGDRGFSIQFLDNGSQKFTIGNRGSIVGTTQQDIGYLTESGLSHIWMVNGSVTPVMTLNSSGDLGIGTTTIPHILSVSKADARIHIKGTTTTPAMVQFANDSGNMWLAIDDLAGASFSGGSHTRHLYSAGLFDLLISTNGVGRMRFESGGNVLPGADGTQDLGSSSKKWNDFRAVTATFTGEVAGTRFRETVIALGSSASYTPDASAGKIQTISATQNFTINNPTNAVDGYTIIFRITQDATGSRIVTYGGQFNFGTDIPDGILSTTANAVDLVAFMFNTATTKWDAVAFIKG